MEKDSSLLHRDRSKSSILIGGAVDRYAFMRLCLIVRAGVLDNVQRERDAVFEGQNIHNEIKAVISAILAETTGADPPKGTS